MSGPVTLANLDDHCARCGRDLNVNEPLYRGPGPAGKPICAGCRDALDPGETATAANARALAVDLARLRTSELLEHAASLLFTLAPSEVRPRVEVLVRELHERAAALVSQMQVVGHLGVADRSLAAFQVLKNIGEVRS